MRLILRGLKYQAMLMDLSWEYGGCHSWTKQPGDTDGVGHWVVAQYKGAIRLQRMQVQLCSAVWGRCIYIVNNKPQELI